MYKALEAFALSSSSSVIFSSHLQCPPWTTQNQFAFPLQVQVLRPTIVTCTSLTWVGDTQHKQQYEIPELVLVTAEVRKLSTSTSTRYKYLYVVHLNWRKLAHLLVLSTAVPLTLGPLLQGLRQLWCLRQAYGSLRNCQNKNYKQLLPACSTINWARTSAQYSTCIQYNLMMKMRDLGTGTSNISVTTCTWHTLAEAAEFMYCAL